MKIVFENFPEQTNDNITFPTHTHAHTKKYGQMG